MPPRPPRVDIDEPTAHLTAADLTADDYVAERARRLLPSTDAGAELVAVSKSFGDVEAAVEVDLVVAEGAITVLLGPSGCGKTTILRLIAGLESPDEGLVLIGGQPVAGSDDWVPTEERRVGFVFQDLALFPHFDVAANVGYPLRRRERPARVAELLALVGLEGYGSRRPSELSGGEAQRVALARALAPRPQVLLLDEPFSSLDAALRSDVRAEVARIIRAEGTTALLVTHDQDEALSMGDRVAVMSEGRILQIGTPEEVYRQPASAEVAGLLGSANLLTGEVKRGVLHTGAGAVPVDAPFGPSLAVIRPEDIDLEIAARGNGVVTGVEYFGADQTVSVQLDSGETIRARLHSRRQFEVGTRVRARVSALAPKVFRLPKGRSNDRGAARAPK